MSFTVYTYDSQSVTATLTHLFITLVQPPQNYPLAPLEKSFN